MRACAICGSGYELGNAYGRNRKICYAEGCIRERRRRHLERGKVRKGIKPRGGTCGACGGGRHVGATCKTEASNEKS